MTLKEKIICTAYTGINFCGVEDEFDEFQKYLEEIMGRPVQTFEMARESFWNAVKELSRADFHRVLDGDFEKEEGRA